MMWLFLVLEIMMKNDKEIIEEGRKAAIAWYNDKSHVSTNPHEEDAKYDLWEEGWNLGVKQFINMRKNK